MYNIETKTFKDVYGDHSNKVHKGNLDITYSKLTSLEGCYKEIKGDFNCSGNKITSFKYCPDVKGSFSCSDNQFTSFEYCPDVKGDFECSYNEITSFKGCPDIKGSFSCSDNQFTSFKDCPDVKGDFDCDNNKITSFEHCPDVQGNFYCSNNPNLQIDTDESLQGLLKADIQGKFKASFDTTEYKKYKEIYKNTKDFKKTRILADFIKMGNE